MLLRILFTITSIITLGITGGRAQPTAVPAGYCLLRE
jgi:hypothetical protein